MEQRIKQVMEFLGLSQLEFAQKLELSPSSLSNIFTGRSKATINHATAIHKSFPAINMLWLQFGEGDMLVGGDATGGNENSRNGEGSSAARSSSPYCAEKESGIPDSEMGGLFSNLENLERKNPAGGKTEAGAVVKTVVETKIVRPKVIEIRVYYDDQTFESFIPTESRNVSR